MKTQVEAKNRYSSEQAEQTRARYFDVLIVGAGVAGLIQATVLLQEAHKRNLHISIGIVDKGKPARHAFLGADIPSNSQAIEFLDFVDEIGPLANVRIREYAQRLQNEFGTQIVNLRIATKFYEELAEELKGQGVTFIDSPVSYTIYDEQEGTHKAIKPGKAEVKDNKIIATARHVVYATGVSEWKQTQEPLLQPYENKIVLSSHVENNQDIHVIRKQLLALPLDERKEAIIILGNSYSAWASAQKLVQELEDLLPEGGIIVAHRGRGTNLFFETVDEAQEAGFSPLSANICQETGRVHRFDGVRAEQKQFYLAVATGKEKRVKVVENIEKQENETYQLFQQAAIIVQAIGLATNLVSEFDVHGNLLGPHTNRRGQAQTSPYGNLNGIPKAYGIGLGYDSFPASELGGAENFYLHAANIDSGKTAPRIANQILENILEERRQTSNENLFVTA